MVSEGLNAVKLLKYLNFNRILNLVKFLTGYTLSILFGKVIVWGMPAVVSVEPTNLCNLKCPECPTGAGTLKRTKGIMELSEFRNIINQCHKNSFYIQLFFQGEPFLNPELFRMIEYAKEKKMFVSISTNGHFLKNNIQSLINSPPDKLIISFDGLDENAYQSYRKGGSLKVIEEGLNQLVTAKRISAAALPFIELQFIVTSYNEHQIGRLSAYLKNSGADNLVVKTIQINSTEDKLSFLPLNNNFSRYSVSANHLKIKNKMPDRCLKIWQTAVFTWDGWMVPCCFDKDAHFAAGNINQKSLKDVWKSDAFNSFRKRILNDRKSINICRNCTEGMSLNLK